MSSLGGRTAIIFVSDGNSGEDLNPGPGQTGRILKYDRDGNFITQWGEIGFRPGQFRTPHALEFDSQGRLFVADRGNNRIQIFDQGGELLDIYHQYSRTSGLYITDNDMLYAIDSESTETQPLRLAERRAHRPRRRGPGDRVHPTALPRTKSDPAGCRR